MWDFLARALGLLWDLFKEWKLAKERARKADEKYQLDDQKFNGLVDRVMGKIRTSNPKDSAGAGKGWDKIEEEMKKKE